MVKRILLLDTSFSAKPIYDYLLSTGNVVYVVGGNPKDSLAKISQNYIELDYSDVDKVKSLIIDLGIDFLVPGGNDFSYKICSEINSDNKFFNIDTVEVNETINNKEKFRKFAIKEGLKVPRIIEIDSVAEDLPVIVKPVDAYSGHGISVIMKPSQVAVKDAVIVAEGFSKTNRCVIEEFVQGQLYSHSAFIVDGAIMIDFIVEEHCIVNKYVVDTSKVIFNFNETILLEIRENILKLAKSLSLVDGLVHTQFISNGIDFWIIEVTRRCPGDLYSKLIEYSTDFHYAEFYARPFIGNVRKINNHGMKKNYVMRHTVTLPVRADFNMLSFNCPVNNLRFIPLISTGDELKASPYGRVGLIFAYALSDIELNELMDRALSRRLYSVE